MIISYLCAVYVVLLRCIAFVKTLTARLSKSVPIRFSILFDTTLVIIAPGTDTLLMTPRGYLGLANSKPLLPLPVYTPLASATRTSVFAVRKNVPFINWRLPVRLNVTPFLVCLPLSRDMGIGLPLCIILAVSVLADALSIEPAFWISPFLMPEKRSCVDFPASVLPPLALSLMSAAIRRLNSPSDSP